MSLGKFTLKFCCFVLLVVFTTNVPCFAQNSADGIDITAKVDTNAILIGDQIELSFLVSQPSDIKVSYPFLVDSIGKFEIVDFTQIDTISLQNNILKTQQKLFITAWDSGAYSLPAFTFKYKKQNSNKTIRTQAIKIAVSDVDAPPEAGIRPNKEILDVPFTWKEAIPYIIRALLFLTLLLIGVYVLYRTITRKKEEAAYVAPPPPAHEIALAKIQALKKTKMWQEDDKIKGFYSELTDILREYIEKRYKFPALESTTDEIVDDLRKETDISKGLRGRMQTLFSMADLVKFAKAKPPTENHLQGLKDAEAFVQHTKQKEEVMQEATTANNDEMPVSS